MRQDERVKRDKSLVKLGFFSYSDYLNSPMWKAIRYRVLEKAKFLCQCCGGKAWEVHHKSYDLDTMRGRRLDLLLAVCGPCHVGAEFDVRGKVDLPAANERMFRHQKPSNFVPDKPERLSKKELRRRKRQAMMEPKIQEMAAQREAKRLKKRKKRWEKRTIIRAGGVVVEESSGSVRQV